LEIIFYPCSFAGSFLPAPKDFVVIGNYWCEGKKHTPELLQSSTDEVMLALAVVSSSKMVEVPLCSCILLILQHLFEWVLQNLHKCRSNAQCI